MGIHHDTAIDWRIIHGAMWLRTIFASLLLFAASSLFAQGSHPDGYDWGKWNPNVKIGFVMGYIEATHVDSEAALAICMDTANYLDSKKISVEGWKQICTSENNAKNYSGIPMGQFVDGADAFYRDYQHRNLEVGFALQYVRDQMRGKSQADLDAEVATWQTAQQSLKK